MAVAYVTSSNGAAVTPGSAAGTVLLVLWGGGSGNVLSGITFAGTSMTLLREGTFVGSQKWAVYYLFAPDSGSNAPVFSESSPGFNNHTIYVFSGVDTTTAPPDEAGETGTSSTGSATISTTRNASYVLGFFVANIPSGTSTFGTNMTNNRRPEDPRSNSVVTNMTAWMSQASAGSVNQTVSWASSVSWAGHQTILQPPVSSDLESILHFNQPMTNHAHTWRTI